MLRFACFGGKPQEVLRAGPDFNEKRLSFRAVGALLVVPYTRFLCLAIFLQVVMGEAVVVRCLEYRTQSRPRRPVTAAMLRRGRVSP